jgi:hypothetical protein
MRSRLAQKARINQIPYWTSRNPLDTRNSYDVIENSLTKVFLARKPPSIEFYFLKSNDVLLNSLAILAYTNDNGIFRHWKAEFDFDAMVSWLVEQQDSNRQYENALVKS